MIRIEDTEEEESERMQEKKDTGELEKELLSVTADWRKVENIMLPRGRKTWDDGIGEMEKELAASK